MELASIKLERSGTDRQTPIMSASSMLERRMLVGKPASPLPAERRPVRTASLAASEVIKQVVASSRRKSKDDDGLLDQTLELTPRPIDPAIPPKGPRAGGFVGASSSLAVKYNSPILTITGARLTSIVLSPGGHADAMGSSPQGANTHSRLRLNGPAKQSSVESERSVKSSLEGAKMDMTGSKGTISDKRSDAGPGRASIARGTEPPRGIRPRAQASSVLPAQVVGQTASNRESDIKPYEPGKAVLDSAISVKSSPKFQPSGLSQQTMQNLTRMASFESTGNVRHIDGADITLVSDDQDPSHNNQRPPFMPLRRGQRTRKQTQKDTLRSSDELKGSSMDREQDSNDLRSGVHAMAAVRERDTEPSKDLIKPSPSIERGAVTVKPRARLSDTDELVVSSSKSLIKSELKMELPQESTAVDEQGDLGEHNALGKLEIAALSCDNLRKHEEELDLVEMASADSVTELLDQDTKPNQDSMEIKSKSELERTLGGLEGNDNARSVNRLRQATVQRRSSMLAQGLASAKSWSDQEATKLTSRQDEMDSLGEVLAENEKSDILDSTSGLRPSFQSYSNETESLPPPLYAGRALVSRNYRTLARKNNSLSSPGSTLTSKVCSVCKETLQQITVHEFRDHVEQCREDSDSLPRDSSLEWDVPRGHVARSGGLGLDQREEGLGSLDLPLPYDFMDDVSKGVEDSSPEDISTKFRKISPADKFVETLAKPEQRSTAALQAVIANAASALKIWQDEWILLERRVSMNTKRKALDPRPLLDPIVWEDQKESELYGYTWDPNPTKRGAQDIFGQRQNRSGARRELRKRGHRRKEWSEIVGEDDAGAQENSYEGRPRRNRTFIVDAGSEMSGVESLQTSRFRDTLEGSPRPSRRGRPRLASSILPARIRALRDGDTPSAFSSDAEDSPASTKKRGRPPKIEKKRMAASPQKDKEQGESDQAGAEGKKRVKSEKRSAAMQAWWNIRKQEKRDREGVATNSPGTSLDRIAIISESNQAFQNSSASISKTLAHVAASFETLNESSSLPKINSAVESSAFGSSPGAGRSETDRSQAHAFQKKHATVRKDRHRAALGEPGADADSSNSFEVDSVVTSRLDDGLTEYERFQKLTSGEGEGLGKRRRYAPIDSQGDIGNRVKQGANEKTAKVQILAKSAEQDEELEKDAEVDEDGDDGRHG